MSSNIVFNYGHTTIPRHLRDIVVTEYGIADLRGKCDQEIIAGLLNITDSRFQGYLLKQAKESGEIAADYEIPECFRQNTPERIQVLCIRTVAGVIGQLFLKSPHTIAPC